MSSRHVVDDQHHVQDWITAKDIHVMSYWPSLEETPRGSTAASSTTRCGIADAMKMICSSSFSGLTGVLSQSTKHRVKPCPVVSLEENGDPEQDHTRNLIIQLAVARSAGILLSKTAD